jgi:hypothetical protein
MITNFFAKASSDLGPVCLVSVPPKNIV